MATETANVPMLSNRRAEELIAAAVVGLEFVLIQVEKVESWRAVREESVNEQLELKHPSRSPHSGGKSVE